VFLAHKNPGPSDHYSVRPEATLGPTQEGTREEVRAKTSREKKRLASLEGEE
jgi:hypothetical protein